MLTYRYQIIFILTNRMINTDKQKIIQYVAKCFDFFCLFVVNRKLGNNYMDVINKDLFVYFKYILNTCHFLTFQ